jgi:alkylresorcinol/alkylpyrone synthase
VAAGTATPEPVTQDAVRAMAMQIFPELEGSRYLRIFDNAGIERRPLVQPLEWYAEAHPLAEREALAVEHGLELGTDAGRSALARAGVEPDEIDALVFVSTTVLRAPNLDVSLVPALGLRHDVRRVPLFGFASLGGAAGTAMAADLVRAGHRKVLVVAAETNSLMFVPDVAFSPESAVILALFSDGAGAVVVGPEGPLQVVGSHVDLVPESLPAMGFDPDDEGLRWRLASDVPDLAAEVTRPSAEAACASVGWTLDDVDHLLLHPGGVKILETCAEALGVDVAALERSFGVLADLGNLSSATVIAVLERFLADGPPSGRVLLTAMGPGFALEHVMMQSNEA